MDIKQRFGLAVRRERDKAKLTQEALANRIGKEDDDPYVDQAYISRIETGQINVSLETVQGIAEALGIDPADLLAKP